MKKFTRTFTKKLMNKKAAAHPALLLITPVLLALSVSSCFNNGRTTKASVSSGTTTLSTTTSSGTFILSQVQETTENSKSVFKISVQSSATSLSSTAGCGVNGKDCVCVIRWVNKESDGTISLPRQPATTISAITATQVTCERPADYLNESFVTTGTTVKVSLRRPSDLTVYVSNEVDFQKGMGTLNTLNQSSTVTDISRYTCSSKSTRDTAILTAVTSETDSTGATTTLLAHSTRFCIPGSTSSANGSCAQGASSSVRDSNQRNVYNFYTRNANLSYTSSNNQFTCPEIATGIDVSTNNKVYPLDRSFGLSSVSTADYFVPVEANVKISGGSGDPSSTGLTCGTSASANPDSSPTVVGCLGFAAKPNSAGACPVVTQTVNGVVKSIRTYRLRKYFAVFPQNYERDGSPSSNAQSVDTVYILDRPVFATGATATTFATTTTTPSTDGVIGTALGPKPCPFAYRDMNGVIDNTTAYYATNSSVWTGRNLDGIKLPGTTTAASDSCTATFPAYINPYTNDAELEFHTVNAGSVDEQYYIRPMQPWALHYEEDTSFLACAPRATLAMDPPIHVDSTGQNYCAEVHPNTIIPGVVANSRNTRAGHTGDAQHDISAASFSGAGAGAPLPLLAPKADIEPLLSKDSSFQCTLTSVFDATSGLSLTPTPTALTCCSQAANQHFEPTSAAANRTCFAIK